MMDIKFLDNLTQYVSFFNEECPLNSKTVNDNFKKLLDDQLKFSREKITENLNEKLNSGEYNKDEIIQELINGYADYRSKEHILKVILDLYIYSNNIEDYKYNLNKYNINIFEIVLEEFKDNDNIDIMSEEIENKIFKKLQTKISEDYIEENLEEVRDYYCKCISKIMTLWFFNKYMLEHVRTNDSLFV